MELVKLELIFYFILEVNMNACLVQKDMSSTIGDTLMMEKYLILETLKVVDAVVMVGMVDEVDVVGVVVVVEEVEDGLEANLKAKLHQLYQKMSKMNLISSLIPWKPLQLFEY